MQKRTLTTLTIGAAVITAFAFTGCAHRRVPTDNASTQRERARTEDSHAKNVADPNAARLTFTSSGMPMIVAYSMSKSLSICSSSDFVPVGRVFDSGRQVLLPWIARLTETANKGLLRTETARDQYVQPGAPIQVKGVYGSEVPDRRYDSCGPLVSAFTPEPGHKYRVNFAFDGRSSCSQSVMDVTEAEHPVPAGHAVACPKGTDLMVVDKDRTNYLKAGHEKELSEARQEKVAATSGTDAVSALKKEAAALDSLGQAKEALVTIDRALAMTGASERRALIATKAGVLFNLNDPQAALTLLVPEIDSVRRQTASQPSAVRAVALGTFTEGFVTATFAHMQLNQWKDAIDTLADAQSPLEGASFLAYRSVLYRYIMARAQNPSLANATLEHDATYYAEHASSHYGALLRMWRGEQTSLEVAGIFARMSGTERQEARGEVLFYEAAYLKFVKGTTAGANAKLAELNQLAPYGSVEWIYGQRVLQ